MKVVETADAIKAEVAAKVKKALLKQAMSVEELADLCTCPPKVIRNVLQEFRAKHHTLVERTDKRLTLNRDLEQGGKSRLVIPDRGDGWKVIGFAGDRHHGNKNERLDVERALYDIFEKEGISIVLDTGNMIDGECRFNKNDLIKFGMDNQIDYHIEVSPHKKGIATYFITGDDHEGWYAQREAINIGEHIEDRAKRAGREDLKYLSNVEHDIELKWGSGFSVLRMMHPGGGSSYAYSYTSQKTVESFQGGEKPHILMSGHYHKWDWCQPRGVNVIQTGTCEDQTTFMRKKKLEAHVGGGIVWFKQDSRGTISRLRVEWIPFYDRSYYARRYE